MENQGFLTTTSGRFPGTMFAIPGFASRTPGTRRRAPHFWLKLAVWPYADKIFGVSIQQNLIGTFTNGNPLSPQVVMSIVIIDL
jgi:hypothetical protein